LAWTLSLAQKIITGQEAEITEMQGCRIVRSRAARGGVAPPRRTAHHGGATHIDEPTTAAQRRADALRRAATSKSQAATARAETAIPPTPSTLRKS
jgi:hypothetical protein